jgi:chain length determinant protein EpsF
MNIRQFLLILRLRWPLVLALALVAGVVSAVISIRMPKVYTTQTSLLLDVKADPLVATFMPAIASPAFLATQSHIIRSDRVAAAVIQRLGLTKNPDAVARWKQATDGKMPLETFYANMLQRGLVVEPAPGTNVLNITFTAADSRFAAVVANAYAQAYIDFSVDLRVEPAKQYAAWFDQRAKDLRADLDKARAKLLASQRENGVAAPGPAMDEELAKLTALNAQLANAMAENTDVAVRARSSGQETSPDVQQSGAVQNLKANLAKLEAEFADAGARFGPSHPQYQQLQQQVSIARQQLASEMRRVSGTSATITQATVQKVNELKALVAAQKERVLNLRSGRDDVEVLLKDVEMTQQAFDAVAQRRAQLSLESQSDQAGARILSTAVEPLAPSKPRIPINIMIGTLGGLALGAALACLLELMDRRIRSVGDLRVLEGIPVLVTLTDDHSGNRALPYAPPGFLNSAMHLLGNGGR